MSRKYLKIFQEINESSSDDESYCADDQYPLSDDIHHTLLSRYQILSDKYSTNNDETILPIIELIKKISDKLKQSSVEKNLEKNLEHSEIVDYVRYASQTLDNTVYSMDEVKTHIINYVAKNVTGIKCNQVLGLEGPSGVGKTKIIMDGLSKVLDRPFHHIALGGLKDVTLFTGTSSVWRGSHEGILARIIAEKGPNCVVFIDEIDKVSQSEAIEIYGFLTHLFDPCTDHKIYDDYLGTELDLSHMMFVVGFNDSTYLTKPLISRINILNIPDYTIEEKNIILSKYVLNEILSEMGIPTGLIKLGSSASIKICDKLRDYQGIREHKKMLVNIIDKILLNVILSSPSSYHKLRGHQPVKSGKSTRKIKSLKYESMSSKIKKMKLPYTIKVSDIPS
jgi:ATP-dependent Lon protease